MKLATLYFFFLVIFSFFAFIGCAPPGAIPHTVIEGPPGAPGQDGRDGQDGAPGQDGRDGRDGANGADGQPARVVPLCPGVSNYGVFVEVALCINNQLFAVYSTPAAFLTLIPPGRYSSQGVGSACNFTVLPNCQITP